jgi:hypothetical protein
MFFFRFIVCCFFIVTSLNSFSQNKEFKWDFNDTMNKTLFRDTNQIIEWGKIFYPHSHVEFKKHKINNFDVFILVIDVCSGLYCSDIYVFKFINEHWHLMASTKKLRAAVETEVDDKSKRIIFKRKLTTRYDSPTTSRHVRTVYRRQANSAEILGSISLEMLGSSYRKKE